MILEIVKYGNAVLRQKGARIEKVNADLKKLIADMFETMHAAKGVGLAAQQVGRALQLTVLDVRGITDRPSTLERDGKEADVAEFMPLVLINPEIKPLGDPVSGPEGCLSFPEIYAEISRAGMAEVRAMNDKGEKIDFRCGGLLARAIQHEMDHLNGILFIDRMIRADKDELKEALSELQAKTKAEMKAKK
ncbi:MAG TPA: peptide deformylase [Candidatus Saccharimonadales bacterium]|nr:peptide deformylase [Candidatus Saccharimonadales bacterium]